MNATASWEKKSLFCLEIESSFNPSLLDSSWGWPHGLDKLRRRFWNGRAGNSHDAGFGFYDVPFLRLDLFFFLLLFTDLFFFVFCSCNLLMKVILFPLVLDYYPFSLCFVPTSFLIIFIMTLIT
ncbi:hypothetical protein V8C34DRAFT_90602 [Trichoderma compactum]